MEEVKEYVSKESTKQIPEMGTIMDAVPMSEAVAATSETMNAAIANDQLKKLEVLAKNWKDAHTQKVRKYDKVGRNEPCPCGSGKKFKNCCMNKKNWNELKPIKK